LGEIRSAVSDNYWLTFKEIRSAVSDNYRWTFKEIRSAVSDGGKSIFMQTSKKRAILIWHEALF
jgi:hypothetical protein